MFPSKAASCSLHCLTSGVVTTRDEKHNYQIKDGIENFFTRGIPGFNKSH